MNKIMDKLKKNIITNKKMIIFFTVFIIVGIVAGSLFSVTINSEDKKLVSTYLNTFLDNIKGNNINYYNTFLNLIISNSLFIGLIWLLGFSIIGLPITLFMFFSKAFSLGFSISSLIVNYQIKGIFYGVIYILPCQILYFMAYSCLMIYSVTLSLKLLSSIIKKKSIDFKYIINRYLFILLITFIVNVIGILFETFIIPILLKLILLI